MDPTRTVGATEWTRDAGRTVGRTDWLTEGVKPIYPATNSFSWGYNNRNLAIIQGSTLRRARMPGACRSCVRARAGVNSDFAIPIPIPIPIPAFSDFTIPIPIPELTIPIPIPDLQFQFQFRSQGGTNMPRQYIYILLLLD